MSKVLNGRLIAKEILQTTAETIRQMDGQPRLQIALVGHNPASELYVRRKSKMAAKVGIEVNVSRLDDKTTTDELLELLEQWNADEQISAILVQLPLPHHIDRLAVISQIEPTKDADGLHPLNLGLLMNGQPLLVPATALGIMRILEGHAIEVTSKQVVVVGRSVLVGQPAAMLLSQAGATVTIAHRQTLELTRLLQQADIIVSAAGEPGLIGQDQVNPSAIIIDVGITRTEQGIAGDADPQLAHGMVEAISPVPGGVGPLTVACLMENVALCHSLQQIQAFDG